MSNGLSKEKWNALMYIKWMQGFVTGKGGKWEDRRSGKSKSKGKNRKKKDHSNTQEKWEKRAIKRWK